MNKFLPVTQHVIEVYKSWYILRDHLPKKARYVLGEKIESILLELSELLFIASYQNEKDKLPTLEGAVKKIDILKFFLRIAWELKALDNKKYLAISEKVQAIGKMVGGWKRGLLTKTLPFKMGEKTEGVLRNETVLGIPIVTKIPGVDVPLPVDRVPVDVNDKNRTKST